MTIATDIICGFPTETEKDFENTMVLCRKYKFPSLFINQFFPRPGTPAAKMTRVPGQEVKKRTKALSDSFRLYEPYGHKVGHVQEVLVTDVSHDKNYYVAHNEFYEQVLVTKKGEVHGQNAHRQDYKRDQILYDGVAHKQAQDGGTDTAAEERRGIRATPEGSQDDAIPICCLLVAVVVRLIWILL
ncbi:unnamed protein product [Parnassius apollo]|uniref:(apollo) hypothetical protein n=1 Tax=Parnassius apollo TaxID=110799 RepID=A0A8S3W975_PARAO|nr:unnamed protein product [Parnassius apollo]